METVKVFLFIFIIVNVFFKFQVNGELDQTTVVVVRYLNTNICLGYVVGPKRVLTVAGCLRHVDGLSQDYLSVDIGSVGQRARYLVKNLVYSKGEKPDLVLLTLEVAIEDPNVVKLTNVGSIDRMKTNDEVTTSDTSSLPFTKSSTAKFVSPDDCLSNDKFLDRTKFCVEFEEPLKKCPLPGVPLFGKNGLLIGIRLDIACEKYKVDLYANIEPYIGWLYEVTSQ